MPGPRQKLVGRLARIACVVGSLVALIVVFTQVDARELLRALRQARLPWIAAASLAFGLGFAAAAARWHLVLRLSGCAVHPVATLRSVLAGHLFNTILLGPAGGDLVKGTLYARWFGFATSSILATCALDRFLGGIGFFIFMACAPGVSLSMGAQAGAALEYVDLAACGRVVSRAGAAACRRSLPAPPLRMDIPSPQVLGRVDGQRRPIGAPARGRRFRCRSRSALPSLSERRVPVHLEGRDQHPLLAVALFWVFPVISLITAAPITVAGAGAREGAALFFFGLYGIPAADAVAAALLTFGTYLVWAVLGALIAWDGERAHCRAPNIPDSRGEALRVQGRLRARHPPDL